MLNIPQVAKCQRLKVYQLFFTDLKEELLKWLGNVETSSIIFYCFSQYYLVLCQIFLFTSLSVLVQLFVRQFEFF